MVAFYSRATVTLQIDVELVIEQPGSMSIDDARLAAERLARNAVRDAMRGLKGAAIAGEPAAVAIELNASWRLEEQGR